MDFVNVYLVDHIIHQQIGSFQKARELFSRVEFSVTYYGDQDTSISHEIWGADSSFRVNGPLYKRTYTQIMLP